MFSSKDYSKLTGDELVTEEKKLKSQSIGAAFFIGMMLGVIFYAVMHQKYLLALVMLLSTTYVGYKTTIDRKALQAELSGRNKAN